MGESFFFIILPALIAIYFLYLNKKKATSQKDNEDAINFKRESDFNKHQDFNELTNRALKYEANRNEAIKKIADILQCDESHLKSILTSINYHSFSIRKRSGALRYISAPEQRLLKVQQQINQIILSQVELHPACTGFILGKSVRDNALAHLGNPYVLKVDLHDFFPSISRMDVRAEFLKLGYTYHEANQLSHLCCYKGKLPQGAATSPALSNIIVRDMDAKLSSLAEKNQLMYTRYADDLTFSGNQIDFDKLVSEIENIAFYYGFYLNDSKTRRLSHNKRKIVTGVSISKGDKMTIPRTKKREIRQAIYHIKTKGLENHLASQNINDERYVKRLLGYLHFWNHIEKDNPFVKSSILLLKTLS